MLGKGDCVGNLNQKRPGFYIIFKLAMDSCEHSQEPSRHRNNEGNMKRQFEYSQYSQTYNIELGVCQANAISKLLPSRYTFQIDRTSKNKKSNSRKRPHQAADSKSRIEKEEQDIFIENNSVPHPVAQPVHTMSFDDMIKRAQKILIQLRKNKNAWPFLTPVDPVAMGIPHYTTIVTEPMDLKTVGDNLNEERYLTISQFYADIELIIKNSYAFNKPNVQFMKLTADFEKTYERLKSEPIVVSKSIARPIQRTTSTPMNFSTSSKPAQSIQRNKSESKGFITITEKKQLAAKIKKLPPDDLFQLGRIVCDGSTVPQNFQLNLQDMTVVKLNIIQEFVQKKLRRNHSIKKQTQKKESQGESSFQSDSDS